MAPIIYFPHNTSAWSAFVHIVFFTILMVSVFRNFAKHITKHNPMAYYTVQQALAENRKGYHNGQRLVLPFKCQIIKVIFDNEIFTQLVGNDILRLYQDPNNTSIYLTNKSGIKSFISKYEVVKLVVCELEDDICDRDKRYKLVCEIQDDHVVSIHEPDEDMLFIE